MTDDTNDPYDDPDRPFWERDWLNAENVMSTVAIKAMAKEMGPLFAIALGGLAVISGRYTALVLGALRHPVVAVRVLLMAYLAVHVGRANYHRGKSDGRKMHETEQRRRARQAQPISLNAKRAGWMASWGVAMGLASTTWLSWPRALLVALGAAGAHLGMFRVIQSRQGHMDRIGRMFDQGER